MDAPYHFYATYSAALTAGFTKDEATLIASAAQFVDDCDESVVPKGALPTCQTNAQLAIHNFDPRNIETERLMIIWMSFHFLPGNLNESNQYRLRPVTLPNLDDKTILDLQKLMCLPYSPLVGSVIDDVQTYYQSRDQENPAKALIRIGMTMHVMADTFAHEYFTGAPTAELNEVFNVEIISEYEDSASLQKWFPIFNLSDKKAYSPALSNKSFGYLGHGRIGHLPDDPTVKYMYRPAWNKDAGLLKNNPDRHVMAYQQMIDAMTYIRIENPGKSFDYAKEFTQKEYDSYKNILKIFTDNSYDNQTQAWKDYLKDPLLVYDKNKLLKSQSFLQDFLLCADTHRRIVCRYCSQNTELPAFKRIML